MCVCSQVYNLKRLQERLYQMISDPPDCNFSHADRCPHIDHTFHGLRRPGVDGLCRIPPLFLHTPLMSAKAAEPLILTETSSLIAQGAEAVCRRSWTLVYVACSCARWHSIPGHRAWHLLQRVFRVQFLGRPTIIKQRFSKKYRHPALDAKLTSLRLKQAGP